MQNSLCLLFEQRLAVKYDPGRIPNILDDTIRMLRVYLQMAHFDSQTYLLCGWKDI